MNGYKKPMTHPTGSISPFGANEAAIASASKETAEKLETSALEAVQEVVELMSYTGSENSRFEVSKEILDRAGIRDKWQLASHQMHARHTAPLRSVTASEKASRQSDSVLLGYSGFST